MDERDPSAASPLVLRLPRLDEEPELLRAYRATPDVPFFLHHYREGMPLRRYLEVLEAYRTGANLPPEHVPSTFLFAWVGERIVGRTSLRHRLNAHLEREGGHIGYAVVTGFRRRGYATEILRQTLEMARDRLGIRRALLTCDDDNVGSIRTIEKNGGVLQDVVPGERGEKPKRRYWIESPTR
jgi:predicted acetyltransferase